MIEEKNSSLPQETGPAVGAIVEDPDGKKTYRLSRYLAGGKHSHIYVVEVVEPVSSGFGETRQKVVKFGILPPDDLTDSYRSQRLEETDKRYQQELELAQAIRLHSNNRFVPDIVRGKWSDESWAKIPVLIMDRMGSDQKNWSLPTQIQDLRSAGRIRDAELLALKAGVQYAELLGILHEKLKKACPDRKPGDFYWDPYKKALYVLDWNVVSDLPEDSNTRAAKIQADIRQFGRYWFEMLVGFPPDRVEDLSVDEPRPGSTWAQLTRGMRRLLVRTISAGLEQKGFQDDQVVLRHWRGYLEIIQEQEPESLFVRAQQAKQRADENFLNRSLWIESWEVIADVYDLLRPISSYYPSQIETWINDREATLEKQLETKLQEGKNRLENGDYSLAARDFEAVAQDPRFNPSKRLRALRWYYVAKALSENVTKNYEASKKLIGPLEKLLSYCEQSNWNLADSELPHITAQEKQYLEIIGAEIKYRCALQQFDDLNWSLTDRLKAYQQARDELEKIRTRQDPLAGVYADLLELDFVKARAVADELRERQREEEIRDQERQEIRKALNQITEKLDNARNRQPPVWPIDLTSELEKWDAKTYTPSWLRKLIALNRVICREGLSLRALDAAEEAYSALETSEFDTGKLKQTLGLAVYTLGYQCISELAKEPRWPFKVAAGIAIAGRLLRMPLLSETQKREIQKLLESLQEYKQKQDETRKKLPALDGLWKPNNLEDQTIDDALQNAFKFGVELFDPIPDNQDPERIKVDRLIDARNALRGFKIQETLCSLQDQSKELISKTEAFLQTLELLRNSTAAVKAPGEGTQPISPQPTSSAPQELPAVAHPAGGESQPSAQQPDEQKRSLLSGRWIRPALLGAAGLVSIGLLLLLLLTPASPLYHFWNKFGPYKEVNIVLSSSQNVPGQGVQLTFVVKDKAGNPLSDQEVTITAAGRGKLTAVYPEQLISSEGSLLLKLRSNLTGVSVIYGPPGAGDIVTASSGGSLSTYTVPVETARLFEPTPTPTLLPPTPTPQPNLQLAIDVTVEGEAQNDTIRPGQRLVYTITVDNSGPGYASDIWLECALPNDNFIPVDDGDLQIERQALRKRGFSLGKGERYQTQVIFAIGREVMAGTTLRLSCTLIFDTISRTVAAREIRVEVPPPLRVIVTPEALDIGIELEGELQVQVLTHEGTEVPGQLLGFSFEPSDLISITQAMTATNEAGKANLRLVGQRIGEGRMKVQLTKSSELGQATVRVWPTIILPPVARIRQKPDSNSDQINYPDRSRPFIIIGRNANTSWLQLRLPNGTIGWVSRNIEGHKITGEQFLEQLPVTFQDTSMTQPQVPSSSQTSYALTSSPNSPLVSFYRITLNGPGEAFLALPSKRGQVKVVPAKTGEPSVAPSGYEFVEVTFWVKGTMIATEQSGLITLKKVEEQNEWACWEVPKDDPAQESDNCGKLPVHSEPLNVVFHENDSSTKWAKVTARALIRITNLKR